MGKHFIGTAAKRTWFEQWTTSSSTISLSTQRSEKPYSDI